MILERRAWLVAFVFVWFERIAKYRGEAAVQAAIKHHFGLTPVREEAQGRPRYEIDPTSDIPIKRRIRTEVRVS